MIIIIMGVSGSGKTTIGKLLAQKLGIQFHDADDYHPSGNVEKMKNGIALTDEDRLPWLDAISLQIERWKKDGAVLACSALKESYRRILMNGGSEIEWVYLHGSKKLIQERLLIRSNHFFDTRLLDSQFEALEEPQYGLKINITNSRDEIMNYLTKHFG